MEAVGEFEYSPKDLIGHGAFAVVFKGRGKKNPSHTVAIKSITKKNLSKTHNLLGKEIKILKELSEVYHENIVALLDCKETSHHVFLVMEYCNGGDLADYLAAKGTLSEDTIRLFLRQLAGAMKALQAKGIVHRDLKPQNILLSHAGKPNPQPHEIRLKIADFGFARFLQAGVMAATLCGSPMYMAPEVIMSMQYDAKADLWSLGTIVFQCLTGRAPFTAQTPQALKTFYERNHNLSPKIPPGTSKELTDLLQGLLRRDPKDRMEFDDFFEHGFIRKTPSLSSSPLPVPAFTAAVPSNPPPPKSTVDEPAVQNNNTSLLEEADDFVLLPSPLDKRALTKEVVVSEGNAQTQPIPVPSQREAFIKMNKSLAHREGSAASPSPGSGGGNNQETQVPRSQPISVGRNSSTDSTGGDAASRTPVGGEISSLSPPSVQFCVGTPPGAAGRRRSTSGSSCGGTPPPPHTVGPWTLLSNSPLRRASYVPAGSGSSVPQLSLPTILGSPTKNGATAADRKAVASPAVVHWRTGPERKSPLTLEYPARAMTLPDFDNVNSLGPNNCNPVGFHRSNTDGQLSSSPLHGRYGSPGHWNGNPSSSTASSMAGWANKRRSLEQNTATFGLGTSPTHPEEPLVFVVPELTEETLLEKEHNETLAKLNFVLALVECIIDIAKVRASPLAAALSESVHARNSSNLASSPSDRDMTVVANSNSSSSTEPQRKREELVLYVRALQFLSSALSLSRDELQAKHLHPSASVKQVVAMLNQRFHHCLSVCKQLASTAQSVDCSTAQQIADKILYNHAIELCQSAALDELFGNPATCCRRYQTAHIIFHTLAQQVMQPNDKAILNKYKDAVEKRLFVLQQQGYIYAYDTS